MLTQHGDTKFICLFTRHLGTVLTPGNPTASFACSHGARNLLPTLGKTVSKGTVKKATVQGISIAKLA